jgi:hypothetical protein
MKFLCTLVIDNGGGTSRVLFELVGASGGGLPASLGGGDLALVAPTGRYVQGQSYTIVIS